MQTYISEPAIKQTVNNNKTENRCREREYARGREKERGHPVIGLDFVIA